VKCRVWKKEAKAKAEAEAEAEGDVKAEVA
jgi:hypothetical protein